MPPPIWGFRTRPRCSSWSATPHGRSANGSRTPRRYKTVQVKTAIAVLGITSLSAREAAPEHLATYVRGHWGAIENKIHWVRDVTFNEDASTLRTGTAPQAMAIIPID